jgi:hypothetical protein
MQFTIEWGKDEELCTAAMIIDKISTAFHISS